MRLVTAIIQPPKLEDVLIALARHGISGLTVTEVSGYARQRGHSEVYRGTEYEIDFVEKVKLEILTTDEDCDTIIDVLAHAARTGAVGDGKLWSVEVNDVIRVRTGERGPDAV